MVFRRNIWLFLGVVVLVIAAAATWTLLQTPIYASKASLLINPVTPDVVDVKSVTPDLPGTSDVVDTQVRLIELPEITRRAADAYAKLRPNDARSAQAGRAELASTMAKMVSVDRSGLTFIIDIEAESSDPQFATDTANLYAEQYIAAQRDAKVGANQQASTWLTTRTAELRDASAQADAALQQYKIANGLLSSNGATNAEQEVSTLNQQIAVAKADLAEKEGRLNAARAQLRAGGKGADVGAALGSGTIGSLRQSEAVASAQVAELQARYGPLYPDLLKAQSQLREIRVQIQQEIDRIFRTSKPMSASRRRAWARCRAVSRARTVRLPAITRPASG
ncbi:GumC family protein [Sphingomonas sp. MMS12-HWE2-04]|uniref:GumC family protein n=1 Tax=Sphingomonas sp. MMS12-HWE2-04 TaxID=3234199 RepID=UPI00384AA125